MFGDKGTIGFSDCIFMHWDTKKEGRHAIQVNGGSVSIRGSDFCEANKSHVYIGENVYIEGNLGTD